MRSLRLSVSTIALAGLVMSSLVFASTAGAIVATCSVKNKTTGHSYSDLQAALDDAHNHDVFRVKGTCAGTFDVDKTVKIRGGADDQATLDGNGQGTVLTTGSAVTVGLRFLLITGGDSSGDGGGVDNQGVLRIRNSEISDNAATDAGGGIFSDGSLKMRHVTMKSNQAGTHGGAISNETGTATLNRVTFEDNVIAIVLGPRSSRGVIAHDARGGALYNSSGGTLNVNNSTIGTQTHPNVADDGGGMFVNSGTVVVNSSNFTYNSANYDGGGIYLAADGDLTLTDSFVTNNAAGDTGGGMAVECSGTFSSPGTTIANNTPNDVIFIC